MRYDDAVEALQPSNAIKQKLFDDFLSPYLKYEPTGQNLAYLMDEGYHAWRLGVKKTDIQNMLFIEKMCNELYVKNEKDFIELVSFLLDEVNDARIRTHSSERSFYEAEEIEEKFITGVKHYKVYFETQLRLWGTIPYFYACRRLGLKNAGTTPETYVKISAATKFYLLKDIKTILPGGDLKELVKGFDTELRNAGDGHDSYEITDNNTILMHVLNPKTGKPVGSQKIELTYDQLNSMISLCRKSIWILRNGLTIFLHNNPEFRKKLISTHPPKISEIKTSVAAFADERRLILDKFEASTDRKNFNMTLRFKPEDSVGKGGELLFDNGERYDLINVRHKMHSKYQIISVLQYLVYAMKEGNTPNISLKILDAKKESIAELEYIPEELKKFFLGKKEEHIPTPTKGTVPDFDNFFIAELKVPYGMRPVGMQLLKSKGYDVVG